MDNELRTQAILEKTTAQLGTVLKYDNPVKLYGTLMARIMDFIYDNQMTIASKAGIRTVRIPELAKAVVEASEYIVNSYPTERCFRTVDCHLNKFMYAVNQLTYLDEYTLKKAEDVLRTIRAIQGSDANYELFMRLNSKYSASFGKLPLKIENKTTSAVFMRNGKCLN